jgi:hypothetical protein
MKRLLRVFVKAGAGVEWLTKPLTADGVIENLRGWTKIFRDCSHNQNGQL